MTYQFNYLFYHKTIYTYFSNLAPKSFEMCVSGNFMMSEGRKALFFFILKDF